MDYSLLVGIHDVDRAEEEAAEANIAAADAEDESPEENGVDEGGGGLGGAEVDEGAVDLSTPNVSVACPTPPDSPGLLLDPPMFSGSFDPCFELFAVKSDESE